MRNKSNYQSSSITADTASREMILFHKWSHRGSELRFLRRISHRNPWPLSPHISNTFRVFSDGLRPFSVFCGKNSPTSLPRLRLRLTRSARRYEDTESGSEVGLRTASPTIRPLRGGTTVGPGAQCTRAALGAWRPNACVLGGSRSRATDSIASAIKHCDLFPVNNKLRSVWLSLPLRRIDCRKTSNSQKTDLKATVL